MDSITACVLAIMMAGKRAASYVQGLIVTTINSSSTNTTVPGAKAVYDLIKAREVTVVDSSSTDEQIPTAKAVYDAIQAAIRE